MMIVVRAGAALLMIAASSAGLAAAERTSEAEKDEVALSVPVEPLEVGIRDEAMMVLVGSALIGAAAAVRRAA